MIVDLPHTVTSSLYSTFFLPLSHPLFFIKSATPQQATGNHQVYEVEIITSAGEILEVIVDAGNGRILGKMLDDDVLEGGAMGDDNDNGDKGDDDDNWEDGQGNHAAEKQ